MHGTKTVPYTARSKRAGLGRVEGGCCRGKTRGLHDELYYKFARQMDYVCVYAVCNLRTTRVIHTRSNYYIQEGKAENPAYCQFLQAGLHLSLDPVLFFLPYSGVLDGTKHLVIKQSHISSPNRFFSHNVFSSY
jgi:hypothetical protein